MRFGRLASSLGLVAVAACSGGSDGPDARASCDLLDNTSATGHKSDSGCTLLLRDASACQAARVAAGLGGFWLQFSCRVDLTTGTDGSAAVVIAKADGLPDYKSNYFVDADACHETYTDAIQNPNHIETESYELHMPLTPSGNTTQMRSAVVGLALNGVAIYGNFAAPGDDIYVEAGTFDRCGAHPDPTGRYHYHTEPFSLTDDDSKLIGVMRDGSPIYGRRDLDGSTPTLDAQGGHTGTTPDSPSTPVYHYHVNLQTSTGSQTAGQQAYFITTGTYHNAPGATCDGCN